MSEPAWTRRFTATTVGFPAWAEEAPDRLALVSNRSGVWQAWALDRSTGSWRQATDQPVGVEEVLLAPDGRIVWWRDATGSERGSWVTTPFEGGEPQPLLRDVPEGWATGISFAGDAIAAGIATDEGYRAYLSLDGEGARLVHSSPDPIGVGRSWPQGAGGLSADGSLLGLRVSPDGDILHPSLLVLDTASGEPAGDLRDEGHGLDPVAWSPAAGDQRLTFVSERGPFERPAIWNPASGERRDLEVDLPGGVFPVAWYPDAASLLVRHEYRGTAQLYRLEIDGGDLELVVDPGGDIEAAAVRPDGSVWLLSSDSAAPPRVTDADGTEVLTATDDPPPAGRPFRSFWFDNPHGESIQGFVVTPEGAGPFPLVMSVHGGPEWHERDRFDAETQAFVDEGFAVALVNYRGSTGYGIAFREALIGNPCLPESEDVIACIDHLVAQGVADPSRIFWSGWSWGGCLGCLNAGLHPGRWRAMFLGIPAGDFVAAHWASAPELQAWDNAVFGGDPNQVPDTYRERNPMTFVDRVRAPILVIAGEADSRCPIEGVTPWVDAVRDRGVELEVHLYPAGHHSNDMQAQVRHMKWILEFFRRHL